MYGRNEEPFEEPEAGESQTPVVPLFQRVASISSRFTRSTGRTEASPLQSGPSSSSGLAASGTRRCVYPTLFGSRFGSKRSRTDHQPKVVTYTRDIFCLPPNMKGHNAIVVIPRGSRRSALADERSGLLGKIVFEADWCEERMTEEITRVFAKPFDMSTADIESGKRLEFLYLQRAGAGARSLCIPSVTSSFEWSGRQVATLAKSGGIIYILSVQEIPVVSIYYAN